MVVLNYTQVEVHCLQITSELVFSEFRILTPSFSYQVYLQNDGVLWQWRHI